MFSLCWFDLWYFYWSWSPSFAFIDRSLLIWFVELVDFFRLICVFDCFIWMFWFVFVSHFCGVGDSWWFTWADSYWNLWIFILWNSLWLDFKLCLACNEDTLRFSLMCILILSVLIGRRFLISVLLEVLCTVLLLYSTSTIPGRVQCWLFFLFVDPFWIEIDRVSGVFVIVFKWNYDYISLVTSIVSYMTENGDFNPNFYEYK